MMRNLSDKTRLQRILLLSITAPQSKARRVILVLAERTMFVIAGAAMALALVLYFD